ncbi:MAG: response regulator [Fibrobacterota bacterium]|nr:response regulator [Fibrobacterota bacterium]
MEKPKLLCIDDDETVLLYTQALLSARYEIFITTSGDTGLELLASVRPDWVLVDYQMPEMDGARFMLSALQLGLKSSFILLTGLSVGRLDWEGLSPLGLKGHLKKPLDPVKLIEIIEGR